MFALIVSIPTLSKIDGNIEFDEQFFDDVPYDTLNEVFFKFIHDCMVESLKLNEENTR